MPSDTTHLIALAAARGWAPTGGAGALGGIARPSGLHILENPFVLAATGTLAVVEFLAGKVTVLDSVRDEMQTLVRIPGRPALAANPHVAKASLRTLGAPDPVPARAVRSTARLRSRPGVEHGASMACRLRVCPLRGEIELPCLGRRPVAP